MAFFTSESINYLYQANSRGENTLKIRQAAPSECIWVTSQVYEDERLQQFVWGKMCEIMEMENDIRTAELSTYVCNFERLII
jgi:hypothetical protein